MCKTFIIKVTSSEIYWRVCGMQILPSGHECFHATQDIQLGVWLWNVTKDLFKKGFPRCLLRSVEVSMQTCSPPSLLDASSHWVWYNGYNEECTSSACSPNRLLVSVGRVLRLKTSPEKGHTQERCTHLDLWARCGRPALFVCVQIFREQASDEITEEQSNISEHILFIDVTQIKSLLLETHNSLLCMSSMRSGKSTSLFLSQNPLISYDTWRNTRHEELQIAGKALLALPLFIPLQCFLFISLS